MADWGDDPVQSMSTLPVSEAHSLFDRVFGKGKWRLTSKFRPNTEADRRRYLAEGEDVGQSEESLRNQGAGTVAPGHISRHSEGTPDAPGAYDITVEGMSPAEAAVFLQKSGAHFSKLFPEGAYGNQGAHLHVEPYMTDEQPARPSGDAGEQPNAQVDAARPKGDRAADDWGGDDPIQQEADTPTPAPPQDAPRPPTPLQRVAEAGSDVVQPVLNIPSDIAARAGAANQQMAQARQAFDQRRQAEARRQYAAFTGKSTGSPLQDTLRGARVGADIAMDSLGLNPHAIDYMGGGIDMLFSPITGAMDALVGRPIANLVMAAGGPKVKAQFLTDVASLAIPFGGELRAEQEIARIAKQTGRPAYAIARELVARRAAAQASAREIVEAGRARKATPEDPARAAAVQRLQARGVRATPGQVAGGAMEEHERTKRLKSPISGERVRRDRNQAAYDFQRATYNEVLQPLGIQYPKDGPVGHDGFAAVKGVFDKAYGQMLPHARIAPNDAAFDQALKQIRYKYNGLPRAQIQQLSRMIQTEVRNRFSAQGMSGEDFKAAEEILGREGAGYRSSRDPDQRQLGYALNEVVEALQGAVERGSPPAVGKRLRQINQAYARFVRLRTAVAKAGEDGVFTPAQLLTSVRQHDRSAGKTAFAEGRAMMQPLAQDASTVLGANHKPVTTSQATGVGHAMGSSVGGAIGTAIGERMGNPMWGFYVGERVGGRLGRGLDPMLTNKTHNVIMALDRAKGARQQKRDLTRNMLLVAQRALPAAGVAGLLPAPAPGGQ